jgi:cyclopropane-fatty-acyl-phospholipid synthase
MVTTMYLRELESCIRCGSLQLHLANGTNRRLGRDRLEPPVHWHLHHSDTLQRILSNPARMLGETYVRDEWHVPTGELPRLLALLMRNFPDTPSHPLRETLQHWRARLADADSMLAPHDPTCFDDWLLSRFLDADLHYQCGYYRDPDVSLEEAQRTMCRRLLDKLQLQPGQHVLDLNANWGSLPLYLAEEGQVRVTALVRSHAQLQYAHQRARARGLQHRVRFLHQDFGTQQECYDRIIGLGVLESQQPHQYVWLFRKLHERLTEDGRILLQCIGRLGAPGPINPWLRQYLLPYQYNPALSEVSQGVEQSGLFTHDVEILHDHYAHTLAAWQRRFQRHRMDIAHRMGERFCRIWEFYLATLEAGFRWRDLALFEWQLGRCRLPTTRDTPRSGAPQSAPELIRRLQQGAAAGKGE